VVCVGKVKWFDDGLDRVKTQRNLDLPDPVPTSNFFLCWLLIGMQNLILELHWWLVPTRQVCERTHLFGLAKQYNISQAESICEKWRDDTISIKIMFSELSAYSLIFTTIEKRISNLQDFMVACNIKLLEMSAGNSIKLEV